MIQCEALYTKGRFKGQRCFNEVARGQKFCPTHLYWNDVKMHLAHRMTSRGIEIGSLSAATRNPDGSKRSNNG